MSVNSARLLLIAVFVARGTSFLFSKVLMEGMSPMSILAVRFLMAFAILAVIFHRRLLACDRRSFRGGVILGLLYTVCMTFEMYGIRLIDTGVGALIENMAIVLVPIFAAVMTRSLPRAVTMFCAVVAVVGVGFLSITQSQSENGGLGIVLIILAALTYAVCIMATEAVSRDADPVNIGIVQLGVMGAISLVASVGMGDFGLPQTGHQWIMLLFLVLIPSCFGFAFQPVGQKYLPAEEAAVITVINPLTASIMGILVAGEGMSISKGIGYVLIIFSLALYMTRGQSAVEKTE
ncbi:MAG: DMT family transporter [Eubacterium sp.]|nr:DMT family transporter [Eubacterium sp.]